MLLQTLQNEWDAAMLEVFTLKQQNNSLRQELSVSLYMQDAATRVVARLMRERDAAREYVPTTFTHREPTNIGSIVLLPAFLLPWVLLRLPVLEETLRWPRLRMQAVFRRAF